jgi:manganese-dependent inorganic pyrophosphatase
MDYRKIYVCGHRNPDVDSLTSACALADLRRKTLNQSLHVEALCAGSLPSKAEWVFNHFGVEPPRSKMDVYVRAADIVAPDIPPIPATMPLIDALKKLEESGESTLPVVTMDGKFAGMLSPIKLLHFFIEGKSLDTPVGEVPLGETLVLSAEDKVHDVAGAALKSTHNHFPVLDESGRLVGTLLKRAFAETPPYRMILVDHNETEQGIPGLEEVPVIEVVDHHRISFSPTKEPIRYTADTVGSTCTLVAKLFRAAGLRPSRQIAGILLAGIVADTLLFQSPTTTDTDRTTAEWLEKLCGETAQSLMDGMMSIPSPMMSMSPRAAIESDMKTYSDSGFKFSLSQIEEPNLTLFHHRTRSFKAEMESLVKENGLDFAGLLVTDPGQGHSEFLFVGKESVKRSLPWRKAFADVFSLPGILSRKKQLLPQIMATISGM